MTDIAITGIGVVSAVGTGAGAFWNNCRSAVSGIRKITAFDTQGLKSNAAAYVTDFDPKAFLSPRDYRRMSRISRMAVVSSLDALQDSGLRLKDMDKDRVAVILGTAYGSSSHVEDFYSSLLADGPRGAQPMYFPETVPNAPASQIAILHGITGPNTTFCQNEISAENAIHYARNLLLNDVVDVALVAGADELSEILYRCYNVFLNPIRTRQGEKATPSPGKGLVLGEGAGMLVMERRDFAVKRGARIYGLLKSMALGGGPAPVGHYEKNGDRMGRSMALAIHRAGIKPDRIGHVNVSANFSAELDLMEYRQLRFLFKEQETEPRVTPLKYLIGDFGGAGILRAAAVCLSLYHRAPLPGLPIRFLKGEDGPDVPWHTPQTRGPDIALMTSSTFGGASASMVFTAFD